MMLQCVCVFKNYCNLVVIKVLIYCFPLYPRPIIHYSLLLFIYS